MHLMVTVFLIVLVKMMFKDDSPLVTTTLGDIIGHYQTTVKNIRYEAYEGIPYAEPPIEGNRFKVREK